MDSLFSTVLLGLVHGTVQLRCHMPTEPRLYHPGGLVLLQLQADCMAARAF